MHAAKVGCFEPMSIVIDAEDGSEREERCQVLTCDNEQKSDGESKVTCQDLTPIAINRQAV